MCSKRVGNRRAWSTCGSPGLSFQHGEIIAPALGLPEKPAPAACGQYSWGGAKTIPLGPGGQTTMATFQKAPRELPSSCIGAKGISGDRPRWSPLFVASGERSSQQPGSCSRRLLGYPNVRKLRTAAGPSTGSVIGRWPNRQPRRIARPASSAGRLKFKGGPALRWRRLAAGVRYQPAGEWAVGPRLYGWKADPSPTPRADRIGDGPGRHLQLVVHTGCVSSGPGLKLEDAAPRARGGMRRPLRETHLRRPGNDEIRKSASSGCGNVEVLAGNISPARGMVKTLPAETAGLIRVGRG